MSAQGGGGRDPHHDAEAKRDRQMIELLNELRIALPGVQILFAFLLTLPFSQRGRSLTDFQVDVYYLSLVASMLSAGCLISPTAAHRLRFHQGDRAWVVESAHRFAIGGLVFLAVSMGAAFLLITDVVFDGVRVWLFSGAVWLFLVVVWFVRPIVRMIRGASSGPH